MDHHWFRDVQRDGDVAYPGGTFLDPSTARYLFFENFLSDLGNATTWGRHSNQIGRGALYRGELALAVMLIVFFAALVSLHSPQAASQAGRAPGERRACLRALASWRPRCCPQPVPGSARARCQVRVSIILVAVALFAFACARDVRFSRRAATALFALTIVLTLYVVMLNGARV